MLNMSVDKSEEGEKILHLDSRLVIWSRMLQLDLD